VDDASIMDTGFDSSPPTLSLKDFGLGAKSPAEHFPIPALDNPIVYVMSSSAPTAARAHTPPQSTDEQAPDAPTTSDPAVTESDQSAPLDAAGDPLG
jgi:hypothetical protein